MPTLRLLCDGARACIALQTWSQDEEGNVLLTPGCVTPGEMESYVDALIRELVALGEEARTRLRPIRWVTRRTTDETEEDGGLRGQLLELDPELVALLQAVQAVKGAGGVVALLIDWGCQDTAPGGAR